MTTAALLLIADGRFPTGGHAHSAGVEAAVRHGDVHDLATLARYLRGRLATTGRVDAAFAASAAAAAAAGDADRLAALDAGLDARTPSPRLRTVSRRLGRQIVRTGSRVAPGPPWSALRPDPHQSVAVGALAVALGGAPGDAAHVVLHHLTAATTGAAVRLLGLDPVAVAALQVDMTARLDELAEDAVRRIDDHVDGLPAATGALSEILGEDHGAWDARLFTG